jgi:D-sedoheptulose 7-phosphate isomerase
MTQVPLLSELLTSSLADHLEVVRNLEPELPLLNEVALRLYAAIRAGKKALWFGNGGSAADAQHLAAELVGRFRRERRGMASVALTTDTSVLTSIGNDYGFDCIFSRQLEALCAPGDIAVGISTSGNSPNVVAGLIKARELGAWTFAMTGASGGRLLGLADATLRIASNEAARIQEAHILAGHMLCDVVEHALCQEIAQSLHPEQALQAAPR